MQQWEWNLDLPMQPYSPSPAYQCPPNLVVSINNNLTLALT